MGSQGFARFRAGILSGLLASAVLGFVIWLFGYITGYRLATSFLTVAAVCFGLLAGRQAYVSNPEELDQRDEVLAELEQMSEDKALGKPNSSISRKSRKG